MLIVLKMPIQVWTKALCCVSLLVPLLVINGELCGLLAVLWLVGLELKRDCTVPGTRSSQRERVLFVNDISTSQYGY